MTQSIQALRERHAALGQELRALVEKQNGAWSADHQKTYDQTIAQMDDLKAQVERIERANAATAESDAAGEIGARAAHLAGKGNRAAQLFNTWLRKGDNALSAQDWADVRATMSTTTAAEGGYTVSTEVATRVVDALKDYGGMRDVATVIRTSGFGDLNYPTSDGTSEVGELIGQNTTATGADPSFGVKTVTAYKYSSKIVAVPFELLQDTGIDMEGFVLNRLVQRVGRITNTHFTTGTGSSQPNGVVTASSLGKTGTTGQTGTVIFEDLIDLVHSVDPAYRALGRCRFMMNDASLKVIRKLKDGQQRPVFLPGYDGLSGAMPDSILGYPVTINQDVATMAANAKSILFGDFSFYTIRDVMAPTLFRFEDSAYAKLGQVGFLMWARAGGNLVDVGGCVKHYANSAT